MIAIEHARLFQALEERTVALARSNGELEQFAYVASHDLQEPLRVVGSYVQLLARRYEGQLDDRADRYITRSVAAVERMRTLINDLLAYSRVGTRGRVMVPTKTANVLSHVLEGLAVTIRETAAEITWDPLPTVRADATQLGQLLQNLLGNALKYRGERPPRIHIAVQRQGERWQFAVRDNGIGIDPEYADRIFLVFQRLHTRDEYPGTGIGLAICQKIVERHGGAALGRIAGWTGSDLLLHAPGGGGGRRMSVNVPGAPIEMLLVEDNPDDVDLTIEALEDAKIANRLHVVSDGVAALSFLHREGEYVQAPRPRPHSAGPEPAEEERPRGAGGDQERPEAAVRSGWLSSRPHRPTKTSYGPTICTRTAISPSPWTSSSFRG